MVTYGPNFFNVGVVITTHADDLAFVAQLRPITKPETTTKLRSNF